MKIATPDTDYANQKDKISIHAIVKIATTYSVNEFGVYTISIHAIVKIATPPLLPRLYDKPHFNPRYREDSDSTKFNSLKINK